MFELRGDRPRRRASLCACVPRVCVGSSRSIMADQEPEYKFYVKVKLESLPYSERATTCIHPALMILLLCVALKRTIFILPTTTPRPVSHFPHVMQASPDGKSLGDCPFTQRANLALKIKNVRATYILIDLTNKPKW